MKSRTCWPHIRSYLRGQRREITPLGRKRPGCDKATPPADWTIVSTVDSPVRTDDAPNTPGSRITRASYTYCSALGFTVISTVVGLLAVPYVLRWLGPERLGAYRVLVDVIGYLGLLEFGLFGSLLPMFAQALYTGQPLEQRQLLVLGTRASIVVVLVAILVGCCAAPWLPALIPVSAAARTDVQLGFFVSLAGFLLLPFSPLRAYLEASQRGYVVNVTLIVQSVLTTVCSVLLARAGYGITGQAGAALVGMLCSASLWAVWTQRRFPGWVRQCISVRPPQALKSRLRRLNVPTFILSLCGRLSVMTDHIIISAFLGPSMVAPFFLTQRMIMLAQGQLQNMSIASWAAMGELYNTGSRAVFTQRLLELTKLVAVLGVAVLMPIFVYNKWFIRFWIGSENYVSDVFTGLTVLNTFLMGTFTVWSMCFRGTGLARQVMPVFVAQTVVNVTMSLWLTHSLGLIGPVLGTTISFVVVTLWWLPLLVQHYFHVPLGALVRAFGLPPALGAPFALCWYWLTRSHSPWGWCGLLVEMGAMALFYLLVAWMVLCSADERIRWSERARTFLGRQMAA